MIDLIIATYNRHSIVCSLVEDIKRRNIHCLNQIIIVDSSDSANVELLDIDGVKYIHSAHKNQPYQRYLGYCLSEADHLLFLDDDMQLLDELLFDKIEETFEDKYICGINLLFTNKSVFLENQEKTMLNQLMPEVMVSFIRLLSGRPNIEDGKFWYCGLRGKRIDNKFVEYFSGGAFATRRELMYKNFNFNLFTIFEKKIGMGEDVILAYTLSRQGGIFSLPTSYLYHNDFGNSSYTNNQLAYNRRVAYSRMYLSMEYARLNDKPNLLALFITVWYNMGRLIGILSTMLMGKKNMRRAFYGYFTGMIRSFDLLFMRNKTGFWQLEINKDLYGYNSEKQVNS